MYGRKKRPTQKEYLSIVPRVVPTAYFRRKKA